MRHFRTGRSRGLFDVLHASRLLQAAMMSLRPGAMSDDELSTEHPRSEQWLFVISGNGEAKVGKRRVKLRTGTLLLIEKDEVHQIVNSGRRLLRTINFYAPPAYTADGDARE